MFQMVIHSVTLFVRGRLFAEPAKVYRQLAIGIAATLVLFFVAAAVAPAWIAALAAGFLGGALQPYLFKDLRYR